MRTNFERGNSVKDTLKIGRYANALEIYSITIRGIVYGSWPPEEIEFAHLDPDKTHHFSITGDILIVALEMMEKEGISKKLDNYFKKLIIKRHKKVIQDAINVNGSAGSVIYDIKNPEIKSIYFDHNADSIFPVDRMMLLPKMLDKDVLYQDKLYRIKNVF